MRRLANQFIGQVNDTEASLVMQQEKTLNLHHFLESDQRVGHICLVC
jgi:hypothetical protein